MTTASSGASREVDARPDADDGRTGQRLVMTIFGLLFLGAGLLAVASARVSGALAAVVGALFLCAAAPFLRPLFRDLGGRTVAGAIRVLIRGVGVVLSSIGLVFVLLALLLFSDDDDFVPGIALALSVAGGGLTLIFVTRAGASLLRGAGFVAGGAAFAAGLLFLAREPRPNFHDPFPKGFESVFSEAGFPVVDRDDEAFSIVGRGSWTEVRTLLLIDIGQVCPSFGDECVTDALSAAPWSAVPGERPGWVPTGGYPVAIEAALGTCSGHAHPVGPNSADAAAAESGVWREPSPRWLVTLYCSPA